MYNQEVSTLDNSQVAAPALIRRKPDSIPSQVEGASRLGTLLLIANIQSELRPAKKKLLFPQAANLAKVESPIENLIKIVDHLLDGHLV